MKITVKVSLTVTFLTCFYSPVQVWAKTFYLDGNLANSCVGSTYSIANRNCSGSDGQGVKTLDEAVKALAGGDTLYIRSGTYIRTTNDLWSGSLGIGASGTPAQHTVVRAYPNEQPVICTEVGRCQYNPVPSDTSFNNCYTPGSEGGATCYYPNPAIGIGGQYIDVIGLKTYGQLLIGAGNNILIEGNDLGGGGPHLNQGSVIMINNNSDTYAVTIRNNHIHHSAWGESVENSACLMGYNASYIVENNEFSDCWGVDIRLKDLDGQAGREIIIRNNFFRPSSIYTNGGVGLYGCAQGCTSSAVNVHNNIFLNKLKGIEWDAGGGTGLMTVYNNTFINSGNDISSWYRSAKINVFNNLHYHTQASQRFYYIEDPSAMPLLDSNYNNFYTTASTQWRGGNSSYSTLATWRSGSGDDANSIGANPNFVNAAGNRPEHFKRTSYPNEVSGSKYGTVTGAYVTGNEQIGVSQALRSVTAPLAPTAVTVH